MSQDELIAELESTGDYRVLRRLQPSKHYCDPDGTKTKLAVFIDLETTGLEFQKDEIIELAMVPFRYGTDGRIFEVMEPFDELQAPASGKVPTEIARITGITDEMVRGRTIDADRVTAIADQAALVIAHHADFDRKFAERAFPVFENKPWACSMNEVPWADEGFDGQKLEYLAMKSGFFYDGHRAAIDCHAGIELLSRPLPRSGRLTLNVLLENARQPTCRIWAENSPFDFKDLLKARGYRWSDGTDGSPRSWYKDVSSENSEAELAYLRSEIFQRDVQLPVVEITAFDRYSVRVI